MGTTYEYTYEYEVSDTNKRNRVNATGGNYTHRSTGHQSQYNTIVPPSGRTNPTDPLANLQNDRIWHKLYDPLDVGKATHDIEVQVRYKQNEHVIVLR
jgi:hypothetical protein